MSESNQSSVLTEDFPTLEQDSIPLHGTQLLLNSAWLRKSDAVLKPPTNRKDSYPDYVDHEEKHDEEEMEEVKKRKKKKKKPKKPENESNNDNPPNPNKISKRKKFKSPLELRAFMSKKKNVTFQKVKRTFQPVVPLPTTSSDEITPTKPTVNPNSLSSDHYIVRRRKEKFSKKRKRPSKLKVALLEENEKRFRDYFLAKHPEEAEKYPPPTDNADWKQLTAWRESLPKVPVQQRRVYCNQLVTKEINELTRSLLHELHRLDNRLKTQNPTKVKVKRRLCSGMREVLRLVERGKVKCVILAPNLEIEADQQTPLSDMVNQLLKLCRSKSIPTVFALNRKRLGLALATKKMKLSCVGILNGEGALDSLKELVKLSARAKQQWYDAEKQKVAQNDIDQEAVEDVRCQNTPQEEIQHTEQLPGEAPAEEEIKKKKKKKKSKRKRGRKKKNVDNATSDTEDKSSSEEDKTEPKETIEQEPAATSLSAWSKPIHWLAKTGTPVDVDTPKATKKSEML